MRKDIATELRLASRYHKLESRESWSRRGGYARKRLAEEKPGEKELKGDLSTFKELRS